LGRPAGLGWVSGTKRVRKNAEKKNGRMEEEEPQDLIFPYFSIAVSNAGPMAL
jgi:hypothetical protein